MRLPAIVPVVAQREALYPLSFHPLAALFVPTGGCTPLPPSVSLSLASDSAWAAFSPSLHPYIVTSLLRCFLLMLALFPRWLEFVAGLPAGNLGERRSALAERKPELRHLRQPREIPFRTVFVAWLMIMMIHIIIRLRLAPRGIVALEFDSFADRKRGNPHARQAEMVRAIVVPRLRTRIRTNLQTEFLGRLHHQRIQRRAFP